MALVTVQRELSIQPRPNKPQVSSDTVTADCDCLPGTKSSDEVDTSKRTNTEQFKKQRSVSECYFVVKGAALILPHDECMHVYRKSPNFNGGTNDIQSHLKSMFYLLREEDTLRMAVKLESMHPGRARYLVVVSCIGPQKNEESCLLGIDCGNRTTIGLVLPVFADTMITLDGDGGFSVSSSLRHHIFKPVSVQAMWSALQTLHRCSAKAREYNYFTTGGSHQWVDYYEKCIESDRSCLNEWHAMDDLVSRRPPSPDSIRSKPTEREATENLIKVKLKEVMMSVDLDEVTSKCIRSSLEEQLDMNLDEYKSFIDQEMLMILGQMDAPTEIFEYLYLGSEWNASNLEELKAKGIDHILNVTREIDNFFPGMFDYLNVRVYDDESTEMLKHWDKTFKYIRKVKSEGSKVLVHCKMGISRSASVVIAYVMKAYDWNFEQALDFVRNKRSCIKPNQGFVKQLEIYQGILDASKQRHNSLWRSKSETNLNVIGIPRHLKKKEFSDSRFCSVGDERNVSVVDCSLTEHLNVPGNIIRPKSWSPDDSAVESLFSNSPLLLDKSPYHLAGQKSTTDPSYYLNLEAGRSIYPMVLLKDEDELARAFPDSPPSGISTIPRVSSIKNRIHELESQGGAQIPLQEVMQRSSSSKSDLTTIKSGNMVVNSKSGLVLNLATQFESASKPSTPSPEGTESCETDSSQVPVKFSIDLDPVEPVLSQTKPPVSKHQAVLVKPNTYPREVNMPLSLSNAHIPSMKTDNWNQGLNTSTSDSEQQRQPPSTDLSPPESFILINSESNQAESLVKPIVSSNSAIDNNVLPFKQPSQINTRDGISRQSSSSSCISTPKSVELPFSWSRQSSCSSPSTVSSPPTVQRWPKLANAGLPHSQIMAHNTVKQADKILDTIVPEKNYTELETYTDIKAIQQRLMHLEKTHSTVNDCIASSKDIVYDREEIPWTPGTVRRTKQKLESKTLKRTASFDSSFPAQSRSTPSTPPEILHADKPDEALSPVTRSKSLRNECRPRSMAGVFPSNWHATPAATNCAPIPLNTCPQQVTSEKPKFLRNRMSHSRSTPSVVEAVNQVLCGTREILNSAIQSLPSQSSNTDISNSKLLSLSKNSEQQNTDLSTSPYTQTKISNCELAPSSTNFVEAFNTNLNINSFPGKNAEQTLGSVKLSEKESEPLSTLSYQSFTSTPSDSVIGHHSSIPEKQNRHPCEILEGKIAIGLASNVNYDIGQNEQLKLIKELGRNLVDNENLYLSEQAESNSGGVVKRLTKELEAKSGSPAGCRKEKIVIIDKDSRKDPTEPIKNTTSTPKSPNCPCIHGAKNQPLTSTDTNFLRKARTKSDGSETNPVLDSSSGSSMNSSRRKSSLDMDLIKKSTERLDFNWHNGPVSSLEGPKEPPIFLRNKIRPTAVAERPASFVHTPTNHTTSTGRPPPGVSKSNAFSNHGLLPPPLATSTDASQQKKCRKQQQGKTHPLSKLTPKQRHPNPLYNTM